MKNANLLSNEFNIKLVYEPESVSRVSMKRKVAKKLSNGQLPSVNGQLPRLINA